MGRIKFLSGNALKIIAAISMLIDHIGYLFFPNLRIFRILGRLAFPIFAFMIAEGCRYTKNKLRYFLTMAGFATALQLFYYFYSGKTTMTVIVTFTISILLIYLLQAVKRVLFAVKPCVLLKVASVLAFFASVAGVYWVNEIVSIEYGFFGCILPLSAATLHAPEGCENKAFKKVDRLFVHILVMGVALLVMSIDRGWVQPWSMLSLPVLLLYSGKRGRVKMKYFFYLFYPLHLAVLEGIRMVLDWIR